MKTFLMTFSMLFIKSIFIPDTDLLLWMSIAMVVDFFTGIAKAVVLKQPRGSRGYRQTLTKFLQYAGSIIAGIILNGISPKSAAGGFDHTIFIRYINDGLLIFIIYIEITSIFENLYICDQESKFAKFVIAPILKLLTFQLKGNPLTPITPDEKLN